MSTPTLDALSERVSQLNALMTVAGGENFEDFNQRVKSSYLWLAGRTAEECEELVGQLYTEQASNNKGGE